MRPRAAALALRQGIASTDGEFPMRAPTLTFLFCLLLTPLALAKAPAWMPNLCEWTLALTVLLYHCTFAYDLRGARVALLLGIQCLLDVLARDQLVICLGCPVVRFADGVANLAEAGGQFLGVFDHP